MLKQIENETIDEINQYISSYDFKNKNNVSTVGIEKILEYVKENSELFDLLLNSNGDTSFQQEIIKIIGRQHFIPIKENNLLKKRRFRIYISFFSKRQYLHYPKMAERGYEEAYQ